jgi:hypothetical protein
MESTPHGTPGGENDPGVSVDGATKNPALARIATTGIYLLRGVPRSLQRAARARAVGERTSLRPVLVQALQEYAAGTWTPAPDDLKAMSPAASRGRARFVQICASQNDLFAVDRAGSVHQYNFTSQAWERLVASRSPDSPARGDRTSRGGPRPAFS